MATNLRQTLKRSAIVQGQLAQALQISATVKELQARRAAQGVRVGDSSDAQALISLCGALPDAGAWPTWESWSYTAQQPAGIGQPATLDLAVTMTMEVDSMTVRLVDRSGYLLFDASGPVDTYDWGVFDDAIDPMYQGYDYDLVITPTIGAHEFEPITIGADLITIPSFGDGNQSGSGSQ